MRKILEKLTPKERDFLAGYLMVSNQGGNAEVSEKGMRIAGGRWYQLRSTDSSHTWLQLWLEHALDGQVNEARFERAMKSEIRHFYKELKDGIPSCWPDCVAILKFFREAQKNEH